MGEREIKKETKLKNIRNKHKSIANEEENKIQAMQINIFTINIPSRNRLEKILLFNCTWKKERKKEWQWEKKKQISHLHDFVTKYFFVVFLIFRSVGEERTKERLYLCLFLLFIALNWMHCRSNGLLALEVFEFVKRLPCWMIGYLKSIRYDFWIEIEKNKTKI